MKSSENLRLRQAREKLGLTLDQLAGESGYAASTISSVENGHDAPSVRFIARMADLLGVRAEWLRTGRGQVVETEPAAYSVWLPMADNYEAQLQELAKMLEDFSAQMAGEAEKLKKQAKDFEEYARFRAAAAKAGDEMRRAERTKAGQRILAGGEASVGSPPEKLSNEALTNPSESVTGIADVKIAPQWPELKQRLQKATEAIGAKPALAKVLNVDPTQISQWLSESKNAREPGGDYALRMLKWVERQEGK